jgi:hypothetical protein
MVAAGTSKAWSEVTMEASADVQRAIELCNAHLDHFYQLHDGLFCCWADGPNESPKAVINTLPMACPDSNDCTGQHFHVVWCDSERVTYFQYVSDAFQAVIDAFHYAPNAASN